MRRFELSDGSSNKFWQISRDGAELRVTFGKIGTAGQTQLKDLVTEAAAIAEHDKLIKEKTKKGYAETGAPNAPEAAAKVEKTEKAEKAAKPAKAAKAEGVAEVALPVAPPAPAPVATAPVDLAGVEPYTPEEKLVRTDEEPTTEAVPPGIAAVIATMNGYNSDLVSELTKGLKKTAPAMKAATEAVIAALKAKKGLASADRDQAALLFCVAGDFHVARYLVGAFGFAFAVDAYVHCLEFLTETDDGARYLVPVKPGERWVCRLWAASALGGLRGQVPSAEWDAGIATLAKARASYTVREQRTECNAIARHPAWALEDAATLSGGYQDSQLAIVTMKALTDLPTLAAVAKKYGDYVLQAELLPRLGLAAAPIVLEVFAKEPTNAWIAEQFLGIQTVGCAKLFAQALANKNAAVHARTFFEARPDLAIVALAPLVAAGGKVAPFAKPVLAAAMGARPELAPRLAHLMDAKTRAFLFAPPAERLPEADVAALPKDLQKLAPEGAPKKIAPFPDFVKDLPQVRLKGTKEVLPAAAVSILLTSLRASKIASSRKIPAFDEKGAMSGEEIEVIPAHLLPAIVAAKAACEEKDLAAFAWELFEQWQAAGAPNKENWAFLALGMIGSDDTARKLTPLIRAWPGESLHARATVGLDVLAGIGTDVALMNLHGVAQKLKFKGLQERAREKIEAVAMARGFTAEELADRLVPDFDLAEEGGDVLDFGPRSFKILFDETLKPALKGPDGKILSDLPKLGKSDDAAKATAAVERWKNLKKDAKAIAAGQVLRLELAMCSERRWSANVFRAFLLEHPVVIHLVRRLVWCTYEGDQIKATFRVAEDGTLANEKDDTFTLADGAIVGLPHRLALDAATLSAWGQIIADYGILQPFDQLGRATYTRTAAEAKQTSLELLKGIEVKTGKILGLEVRGWRKSPAEDAGWVWSIWKPLGRGLTVFLPLEGGICMGWSEGTPASQKIGALSLTRGQHFGAESIPFGELSATAYSELVREIEGLAL